MNQKERPQIYSQKLKPEYEQYLAKVRKDGLKKKRPQFSAKGTNAEQS